MSLTPKRRMSRAGLAARRLNGARSRGPVTLAGKARCAAARLRHGGYSEGRDGVLLSLGEDPADYERLAQSLSDDLQPAEGLETELVKRMVSALWRMKRSERMQDGLALKRLRDRAQVEMALKASRFLSFQQTFERLLDLDHALDSPAYVPSPEEIEALERSLGSTPREDMRRILLLLKSLAEEEPGRRAEDEAETQSHAEGGEGGTVREQLRAALTEQLRIYSDLRRRTLKQCEEVESGENRAALMAPREADGQAMQKMEDSSLRQLWRLTNILMRVRRGASAQKKMLKMKEGPDESLKTKGRNWKVRMSR